MVCRNCTALSSYLFQTAPGLGAGRGGRATCALVQVEGGAGGGGGGGGMPRRPALGGGGPRRLGGRGVAHHARDAAACLAGGARARRVCPVPPATHGDLCPTPAACGGDCKCDAAYSWCMAWHPLLVPDTRLRPPGCGAVRPAACGAVAACRLSQQRRDPAAGGAAFDRLAAPNSALCAALPATTHTRCVPHSHVSPPALTPGPVICALRVASGSCRVAFPARPAQIRH